MIPRRRTSKSTTRPSSPNLLLHAYRSFRPRRNHRAPLNQRRLLHHRPAKPLERTTSNKLQRRDIRRHLIRDPISNLHRDERVHTVRRERLLEINVLPRRHGDGGDFAHEGVLDDALDFGRGVGLLEGVAGGDGLVFGGAVVGGDLGAADDVGEFWVGGPPGQG